MIGLKLWGYKKTLLVAAMIINKTAITKVDVLCLFILNVLCAKISNYSLHFITGFVLILLITLLISLSHG